MNSATLMHLQPFVYSQLEDDHVRLLRIINCSPYVECELHHFPNTNSPEYLALSYVWGQDEPSRALVCNKSRLLVTDNLLQAIAQLGKTEVLNECWLWIDQICIDQRHHAEKAVQVKLMSSVYSKAESVLVWLGPEQDDSQIAFESLPRIVDLVPTDGLDNTTPEEVLSQVLEDLDSVWPAIIQLYSRPWFRRGWIMQEVILAQEIFVLCGPSLVQWQALALWAYTLHSLSAGIVSILRDYVSNTPLDGFTSCVQLETTRKQKFHESLVFIFALLGMSARREFADERDRVYGILGLTIPNIRDRVVVDYDSPAQRTYHDFCEILITHESSQTMLESGPTVKDILGCDGVDFTPDSGESLRHQKKDSFRAAQIPNPLVDAGKLGIGMLRSMFSSKPAGASIDAQKMVNGVQSQQLTTQ